MENIDKNESLPHKNNSKKFNKISERIKNLVSVNGIFLLVIFALSMYIRAVLPHDAVFRGGIVGFAADDAVYHMRLVENLVKNFPHRIWFEAFTIYPRGYYLSFGGPLWTYMIAITSIILGLGNPSIELIRNVGAYFPAFIGSLVVFPVYFIGKTVFDKRAGLLSAFLIAVMPGQFLSRSELGFTDHHAGEVLFSTVFLMFFIMAVKSIKPDNISFKDITNKNWPVLKTPVLLSIFAGIFFGLYMLQWSSGIFFGGVIAIFIVLQYILNHWQDKSVESLCIISVITFLSGFPLVLIFVDPRNGFSSGSYSYLHLMITAGSALFFLVLGLISIKMREKNINKIYYPLIIAGIYTVGLTLSKMFIPHIFINFQRFFSIFQERENGAETIAEAIMPTHEMIFGYAAYPNNFQGSYPGIIDAFSTYNIAILAMLIMGFILVIRKWEPEKAVFLTWCLAMFGLTTGQNRWFYYYSVNVAILSAYIGIGLIDISGVKGTLDKFWGRVNTFDDLMDFLSRDLKIYQVAAVVFVILILFLPIYNIASRSTAGGSTSMDYYQWYESLNWMRVNTPDPGLDFDAIYERPPAGENFTYPDTAYGVMSWWDYGHVITYFAHRIPNANPFQSGIGGGTKHLPGASTFFTAQSEDVASKVLWSLGISGKPGSRYVVSNAYMAYSITDIMGRWDEHDYSEYRTPVVFSGQEQYVYTKYWYTTMEGRLHIFDGDGLKQYRLVHESIPNPYVEGGREEISNKAIYNMLYGGNIEVKNTGFVKIFEFVKGATITGRAPAGSEVRITNTIMTNQGRQFTYNQTVRAENGTYSIVVPYSTTGGPLPGETNYDTKPAGPYTLIAGTVSKTIDVSESDVLNGGIITVNLP